MPYYQDQNFSYSNYTVSKRQSTHISITSFQNMADFAVFNIQAEAITLIFSFLISESDSFSNFIKLLFVWERNQPRNYVKFVLESLNWDKLYDLHQHPMEVTRDMFHGFISYSVRHNVSQAMFFNSSQKLLMNTNVEHNLQVLFSLSFNHFPSHFSFIFFKALYRRADIHHTAIEMFNYVNSSVYRSRVEQMITLLSDMYSNLTQLDNLLPPFKFCPNARNQKLLLQFNKPISEEDMWDSVCNKAVQGNYREIGEVWPRGLKRADIWNSKCPQCTLQLIVFKILLSAMNY